MNRVSLMEQKRLEIKPCGCEIMWEKDRLGWQTAGGKRCAGYDRVAEEVLERRWEKNEIGSREAVRLLKNHYEAQQTVKIYTERYEIRGTNDTRNLTGTGGEFIEHAASEEQARELAQRHQGTTYKYTWTVKEF